MKGKVELHSEIAAKDRLIRSVPARPSSPESQAEQSLPTIYTLVQQLFAMSWF